MMLKKLSRKSANINQKYPERILQFGGGNFLRGFADWIIDKYNKQSNDDKLGILAVKVREEGNYSSWKEQEGLFHLFTKGLAEKKTINEKVLITSVVRVLEVHRDYEDFIASSHQADLNIIISNTTELGLAFSAADKLDQIPNTFPGQLTQWLFERYKFFGGDRKSACTMIPCELLENNGQILRDSILQYIEHWQMDAEFKNWLIAYCHFCNSLVDRIVSGIDQRKIADYHERIGFEDQMMTEGEPYHLWAIESKHDLSAQLPLNRIGLNVIYTTDLTPYKELKLKILNGAHTSMVPIGLLLNIGLVKDVMDNKLTANFIKDLVYLDTIPAIQVDQKMAKEFAKDVMDRFRNPFLEHRLKAISLNSISKFVSRVLPSIKGYLTTKGRLPPRLVLSFACLLAYYSGSYQGQVIEPVDDEEVVSTLLRHWEKIRSNGGISYQALEKLLSDSTLWGEDLTKLEGLGEQLGGFLTEIEKGNLVSLITDI